MNKFLMVVLIQAIVVMSMASAEEMSTRDDDVMMQKATVAERARSAGSLDGCAAVLMEYNGKMSDAVARRTCIKVYGFEGDAAAIQAVQRFKSMDEEAKQKLERLAGNVDAQKKIALMTREQAQRFASLSDDQMRETLAQVQVRTVDREDLYRVRSVARERLQSSQQAFEQARQRFQFEKASLADERSSWQQAVADGDDDAALEHAKEYLTHTGNLVIEALHKQRALIDGDDDLSDEDAALYTAQIDEKISLMEGALADVDAAQTKDDVKEASRKVISAWTATKHRLRWYAHVWYESKVGEILSRSEQLEKRLEHIVSSLDEDGVEVENLNELIDEFNTHIDTARSTYKEAQDLRSQSEGDQEMLDQARLLVKEAHDELVAAHEVLRDVWTSIKESGYEGDLVDDGKVEVVDFPSIEP